MLMNGKNSQELLTTLRPRLMRPLLTACSNEEPVAADKIIIDADANKALRDIADDTISSNCEMPLLNGSLILSETLRVFIDWH